MLKYVFVFMLSFCVFPYAAIAADAAHDGMSEIGSCEDAATSNAKARYWLSRLVPTTAPSKDKDYFLMVNRSPWCFIQQGNAGNHYRIMRYSSNGSVSEFLIHKAGEQNWIANNFNKVKAGCVLPSDLPEGEKIIRAYLANASSSACIIFKSPNSPNGLLHSQSDGSNNQKRR